MPPWWAWPLGWLVLSGGYWWWQLKTAPMDTDLWPEDETEDRCGSR